MLDLPNFQLLDSPIIQRIATGNKEIPIIVITQPVTTGGKKRIIFEKNGASNKPINDATMTAPNAEANPPPVVTIAKIVATPAKIPLEQSAILNRNA